MRGEALGRRFESSPNALNFVRLVLALQVLWWHAYALPGGSWLPGRVEQFLGDVAVDGFFAISGFLITRAWLRRRSAGAYYARRVRRIVPGLLGCLLVMGLVIVPAASALAGQSWAHQGLEYHPAWSVPGTWLHFDFTGPNGVPSPGDWNGSLWSLGYEEACYAMVALFGALRFWGPRTATVLLGFAWFCATATVVVGGTPSGVLISAGPRCLLMFTCGALFWFARDLIPVNRWLFAGSAAVLAVAPLLLPDYRVVGAFPLAYLCIVGGVWLGRHPRLVLSNDLSYGVYLYAYPIQQMLIVAGLGGVGVMAFGALTMVLTVPAAAVSWFLLERRCLRRTQVTRNPSGGMRAFPVPKILPNPILATANEGSPDTSLTWVGNWRPPSHPGL